MQPPPSKSRQNKLPPNFSNNNRLPTGYVSEIAEAREEEEKGRDSAQNEKFQAKPPGLFARCFTCETFLYLPLSLPTRRLASLLLLILPPPSLVHRPSIITYIPQSSSSSSFARPFKLTCCCCIYKSSPLVRWLPKAICRTLLLWHQHVCACQQYLAPRRCSFFQVPRHLCSSTRPLDTPSRTALGQ